MRHMQNIEERRWFFERTYLTLADIALELGMSKAGYTDWVSRTYESEVRQMRSQVCYSRSNLRNTPNRGRTGKDHPKYTTGEDGRGYKMIQKPSWFTGRSYSKSVPRYVAVYCAEHDITEVPEGYDIHHIDLDKQNDTIDNLTMMTHAEHMSLHQSLRRV